MKIRHKLAAATAALGLAVAAAAPAQASTIPNTYNGGTHIWYSYSDSSNDFCIKKGGPAPFPTTIGVRFYNSSGAWEGTVKTTLDRTRVCVDVPGLTGLRENAYVKFTLFNSRGAKSSASFTI
ncbi:hypothetical protein KZX18_00565 [Micrococcus luteus]|uniref:hypothetical protein n=1 Tax=Micrococcus luteus TaxID=1270 RepID=UPI0020049068|nr:hypothetical protein [Micrococcus luteus]MCK6108476.1 hypothetical protein [Micrococcus luteus]